MRKKIVAGNWKMNKNIEEANDLLDQLISKDIHNESVEVLVFPPYICLPTVNNKLSGKNISFGAQNCHEKKSGAYTGEISVDMLKSVGCEYVLIGHSERRLHSKESASVLSEKVLIALEGGLIPIFCFGENLQERKDNKHFKAVEDQISSSLFELSQEKISNIILAYEPVWAIGTGETASPEQAQEMHAFVRKLIADKFGNSIASNIRILYGGSCKPNNAAEIFSNRDVDGGLIGGASLVAEDFYKIIQAAQK